ncbi:MAG: CRISPR-associated helicase Cas3' [Betaproteobacteria bacterium]
MPAIYYAHSKGNDKSAWQLLKDHLESVAGLSEGFAEKFGAGRLGNAAGVLHDIGKYSHAFQQRLEGSPVRVDHSTAGAKEALERYGKALGTLLAYVIAGHHAGLPDYGDVADDASLAARLKKDQLPEWRAFQQDQLAFPTLEQLCLPVKPSVFGTGFSVHFFIRMLYSCVVDADFLDTERALNERAATTRGGCLEPRELLGRLERFLTRNYSRVPNTAINHCRAEILKSCREKAQQPPGLFSLTVPTGGGKTLSSLAFALHHAVLHGLERVVYVIPFTSIIEQNAAIFRKAVGSECVLEHHSNFQHPDETSDDYLDVPFKLRLATENWDAPVIVTTNVQFFESLFANRSSRCRKLHNLARSVIILDEAQMLPTHLLKPSLAALCELSANYGSSVLLCTATQPALNGLLPNATQPVEIIEDPPKLYEAFRRVEVSYVGRCEDEDVVSELLGYEQVLCIVNTRSHARELYERIKGAEGAFHLSARMCAAHRSQKLSAIRQALREGRPCRVVSTQLIEAGVDVDFPVVYRAAAGIDSIVQAAGRCNREGRREKAQVFVFEPTGHLLRGWFNRTASVTAMVMRSIRDPISLEAVERYFALLYDLEGDGLDEKRILARIEEGAKQLAFPFSEVAQDFKLIENEMVPIVVPWDKHSQELIREIPYTATPHRLIRQLQPYVVQVYPNEFSALSKAGQVETEGGILHVLRDGSLYCEEIGLVTGSSAVTPEDGAWFI